MDVGQTAEHGVLYRFMVLVLLYLHVLHLVFGQIMLRLVRVEHVLNAHVKTDEAVVLFSHLVVVLLELRPDPHLGHVLKP